jgi:hypothetical protein
MLSVLQYKYFYGGKKLVIIYTRNSHLLPVPMYNVLATFDCLLLFSIRSFLSLLLHLIVYYYSTFVLLQGRESNARER